MPELVIFDCDGVLIDSEIISTRMLTESLCELGVVIEAAEAARTFNGLNALSVSAEIERRFGVKLSDEFWRKKRARQSALFETELKAMPGIAALLDRLSCKRCVGSSSSPQRLLQTLTITGLWDRLDPYIFSAEQVENGKPAPDLFLFAAQQMGIAPEHCVVIEDSIAGVRAAKAAQMRVYGFSGGGHCGMAHGEMLLNEGAEQVFAHMDQLAEVLT